MRTIAVFFGGRSNEREISVITGMLAVNLLRGDYRVLPVYLPKDGGMLLCEKARGVEDFRKPPAFPAVFFVDGGLAYVRKPKRKLRIDCALNCCHGGAGEDGTLAALLAWSGIASASPPSAPSAVFMDKSLTKIAARGLRIPVVNSFTVREEEWKKGADLEERMREIGYPAIVKPCNLGSSIGITAAANEGELRSALELAFRLDDSALVERYIEGKRDLNCAAYCANGEVILSPVEEVFSDESILTFGEKYEGKGTRTSKLPAEIPEVCAEEIHAIMRTLYTEFAFTGVIRGDFLLAGDQVYFNELNTVPGSLSVYLFGESLLEARGFLTALIEEALCRRRALKEPLETGILDSEIFKGGKACKRR